MIRYAQKSVLFASLLFLTLYLPLIPVIYTTAWYKINCGWHGRCEAISYDRAYQGIDDLVSFFSHKRDDLSSRFWSVKEKNHLSEVRNMTDGLLIITGVLLCAVILTYDPASIRRFTRINMIIIIALVAILPFFAYFWRHIFHPLLFNNRNWLNTPFDLSYYIMPRSFFKATLIYMIGAASLLNALIYGLIRFISLRNHQSPRRD